VGIIDPDDVGTFAAHLLALEVPAVHSRAKYILNGPEDITGAQIVEMVQQRTGTKVEDFIFKDLSFLDSYYEHNFGKTGESKNVVLSIKRAVGPVWDGKCSSSTTSKAVLEIAPPRRTPINVLNSMLGEQ
jgi:nucleoside-diphosphate-sugar epimerase